MTSRDAEKQTLRLTPGECRAVDSYAINELGIPGVVLMENAGRNCADLIEQWGEDRLKHGVVCRALRAVIVCGKGNNGGDGFVIARHLAHRGHQVTIDVTADPATLIGDAAINHAIADKMRLPIRRLSANNIDAAVRRWRGCDVIVDAMFGTGFSGALREPLADFVRQINKLDGPQVVAVDVPSGLDAETGEVQGLAIEAEHTITFLAEKSGYANSQAKRYLGKVTVVDIGAPTKYILRRLGIRLSGV
jgi:NAD(P)H-hydrate epimerase